MGTIANNDNLYGPYKWIVNPIAGKGTHTTIQAAVNASTTGDFIFIMPATYTENISLTTSRKFIGSANSQADTIILGKITDGGNSMSPLFYNLTLKTNGDYFISTTSGSSTFTIHNCYLNCSNNTGINSVAGDNIVINYSSGDTGTTGIGIYTGAGVYTLTNTSLTNSGATVTATTSSGNQSLRNCSFSQPFSTSSTGVITLINTFITTATQNATCITTAGSGTSVLNNSQLLSGTASTISIGASTVVEAYKCVINSTNTNPVTGAGTYKSDETTYSNTGILPNTTTRTFSVVGENSSFTPVLTFGGGSTGITYTTQLGSYTRIGNVVFYVVNIVLSNKGSSTGAASITGLPYAATIGTVGVLSASVLTFTGQVNARIGAAATSFTLEAFATTGTRTQLSDTAFANNTTVQISGSYLI